jgi:hypothetical protein
MWNIVRSSVIVAVVLLAGCAEQQPAPSAGYGYSSYYRQVYPANPFFRPYQQPQPAYPQLPPGAAQPSTSSFSLVPQAEAAPAPAPYVPPPRIAPPQVDPPPATPADSSCGWWDPCHLWQH